MGKGVVQHPLPEVHGKCVHDVGSRHAVRPDALGIWR
jgi:hypothetical protein